MTRQRMFARSGLDLWFLLAATAVAFVIFALLHPSWVNPQLLPSLIEQNAPLALVAAGMTFAIISRHIDLSPGAMIALVGAVFGVVFAATDNTLEALLAAAATSLAVALFHGILVARFGLSAIMVTLAAYIWARGLAQAITDAHPIPVDGPLPDLMRVSFAGFTIATPLVVAAYFVGWFLLARTRLGRYTYAMGGDPTAARRHGISVVRYTIVIFIVMAVAVTLASLILIGQLASAQPSVAAGIELDAIIAVVIGGTRLAGGQGNVGRTALGVTFLAVLNSGLTNLGLTEAYSQLYRAGTLILVLAIQVWLRRIAAQDEKRRHERAQAREVAALV